MYIIFIESETCLRIHTQNNHVTTLYRMEKNNYKRRNNNEVVLCQRHIVSFRFI